ncbi:MAG: hypothetical protein SFX73_01215 [Kofleriaceae bacterium]|nr:hypothetical protein [Kofleriaceae bacterium]
MSLRAPPGIQLSTGRLRVDAARAIVKLREYQLVDRMAWVLEAIRGAVALGATDIELTGDANDVWLRWTGTPLRTTDLAGLFDELVSPEPTADRHGVRLLASAVNSALGTQPAYVELTTIDDASAASIVYTPDVLDAPEHDLGDAPLRELAVQTITRAPAAARGMVVHLRRRTTLDVVQNFLRGEPPELGIARAACHTISVPLRVGARRFDPGDLGDDILRVPLGHDLRGFVAVVDPDMRTADFMGVIVEIAERGVVLERFEDAFGLISPLGPMPLRVVIDAPKLPTNASRSEVRRNQHPISTGLTRARELFPEVVAALVDEVRKETPDPRARAAAIALVAAYTAGASWKTMADALAGPIATLADCPLLFNAVGDLHPIRGPWRWSAVYHHGKEPLARELAPWVENIVWVPPGDPARHLVPPPVREMMRSHLRFARRELRTRHRFLRHAQREARIVDPRTPLVRARLGTGIADTCVPEAVFAGLTGEVCIFPESGGVLTLLLEQRELEETAYDSRIGFAAVIENPQLRPDERYRRAVRDHELARVERAMRGQVLRAIEALAAHGLGQPLPDGLELPRPNDVISHLIPLALAGIDLALELGALIRSPLSDIALWQTTDGQRLTLDELRGHPTIGVTPAKLERSLTLGMPVVHIPDQDAERRLIRLFPGKTVHYSPAHLAPRPPLGYAALVGLNTHYLELDEDGLQGAIAVASGWSRIVVFHCGTRIAERSFTSTLVTCTVIVEASHVIPSADWQMLADDRGVLGRDYRTWEVELARAAARALVDERPPRLHGPPHLLVSSALADALFKALTRTDPRALLGDELIAKLRTQPLFQINGDTRLHSIDELALAFSGSIPYLPVATDPLPDFAPLVASHDVAFGIAALLGCAARDARLEIEARRAQLARDRRIAAHRAKPAEPLHAASGSVAIEAETAFGPALIALGRERMELRILVEGRHFETVVLDDLPLHAVLDLQIEHVDGSFEKVPTTRHADLASAIRPHAMPLLIAAAKARPHLASDQTVLELVEQWTRRFNDLPDTVRAELRGRLVFRTVQGDHAAMAEGPPRIAAWHGTWLGPGDGEPSDPLDAQVLYIPSDARLLQAFVKTIANEPLSDVTREIERLQLRRQIARKLVPLPRAQTPAEVTRTLSSFGEAARALGDGEIGLVDGPSFLRVHVGGELRELVPIEVTPNVHVALDAAFLADRALPSATMSPIDQVRGLVAGAAGGDLLGTVRALARQLAHVVLRSVSSDEMSPGLRKMLRRAVLARAVNPTASANVPLFPTIDRDWLSLDDVEAQIARFGELWALSDVRSDARPLDGNRRVLVLSRDELRFATTNKWPVIDAEPELRLDQRARHNLARPRPAVLQLSDDALLAKVELVGDGVRAPRGVVGILKPAHALRRGIHPHRELHPFDLAPDPCAWPTIALVDDARLVPDRTWATAVYGPTWDALENTIRAASEEAWRRFLAPPPNALVSLELTPALLSTVQAVLPSTLQVRGVMWLQAPSAGNRVTQHPWEDEPLALADLAGIGARIYPYSTREVDRRILDSLVEELYARLVRQLADAGPLDDDLVQAHVAQALAHNRLQPAHVPTFGFSCFASPISSDELYTRLRSAEPIGLIDDGSETYRVLHARAGARRPTVPAPAQRPRAPQPQPPRPPPPPLQPPAPARHPFADLADALHHRAQALGVTMPDWRFLDDRGEPLVRYRASTLELATDNAQLIAIAAAYTARSPWATDAIDLLVAHVITVLNVERAEVTDGTEAAALARLLDQRR